MAVHLKKQIKVVKVDGGWTIPGVRTEQNHHDGNDFDTPPNMDVRLVEAYESDDPQTVVPLARIDRYADAAARSMREHRELVEQDNLEHLPAAEEQAAEESNRDHLDRWFQNSGEDHLDR